MTRTAEEHLRAARAWWIANRLPAADLALALDFVAVCIRSASAEDALDDWPGTFPESVLSLWLFGHRRHRGDCAIRARLVAADVTVIDIINDDSPFLVSSVTAALNRRDGVAVRAVLHPVVWVQRGGDGIALALAADGDDAAGEAESFISVIVDHGGDPQRLDGIEETLHAVLADVRVAVRDWEPMCDCARQTSALLRSGASRVPSSITSADVVEVADFLEWMIDDNFTFLGYRDLVYVGHGATARIDVAAGSGLGILSADDVDLFEGLREIGLQSMAVRDFFMQPTLLRFVKSTCLSRVGRAAAMDVVSIKNFAEDGSLRGEKMFAGLLASAAYTRSAQRIPLLRRKIESVRRDVGFGRRGHSYKALLHVLESYPRDELFLIDADQLSRIALGILHLQSRPRAAVFLRPDALQRYISALVFLPRDGFESALRHRIGALLAERLEGEVTAHYTHMSDDSVCRVHFLITFTGGADRSLPAFDQEALSVEIAVLARKWEDQLRDALLSKRRPDAALTLFQRYSGAFSSLYREKIVVAEAVEDIQALERLRESDEIGLDLSDEAEGVARGRLRLRLYCWKDGLTLSAVVPMLENMGMRVLRQRPFDVTLAGRQVAVIHHFSLEAVDGRGVACAATRDAFREGFLRVWRGDVDNDGFNRLILAADLTWKDAEMLRAIAAYLRQIGSPFSRDHVEEALARNPELTALLSALFHARFDPDLAMQAREAAQARLIADILAALEGVSTLDEDRIFRAYLNVIQAMLRTDFFQEEAWKGPILCLMFKIASREVSGMPKPAPFREMFAHSACFEATHLRFGPVARGGLRWSDRRVDFRSEILGLVKAQQVKNAVIIPVGAKGGFVLKRLSETVSSQERQSEGIACYRRFIRGMLSITDNVVAGAIQAPDRVVRWDEDDPYLVVAADKGTSTFSDYANAIALQRRFWLGDAFASGGANGYDHKKMGITARGAWESVRRHFHELGTDVQRALFTVAGVGDMGGDVFGNGVLLSRTLKLVAAFNHAHIFLDPNPDPECSFVERQRLFDCGGGWDQYDSALISKGGGVFSRKAKSIALTPEARALLDVSAQALPPDDVIRAVLALRVDLLWFGGIGLYVKSETESQADAADRVNDALRIDASALRCRVVGEGANLAMTQRARIDFARAGGRLNTDAIDNSAGVDCSDHEVNIKILLNGIVAEGRLSESDRDALLKSMTDAVAALVLRDNVQQTQALSVLESVAAADLDAQQRLMRDLEREGLLDRALEFLPDDKAVATLLTARTGLTRPELSVLLAYGKNTTCQAVLDSDFPEDPFLEQELFHYFPQSLRDAYAADIRTHQLRREIIATAAVNAMINRAGPTFPNEMMQRTGRSAADVARAYIIAREVHDLQRVWREIEDPDSRASAATRLEMLQEARILLTRTAEWFLMTTQVLPIAQTIVAYRQGVETLQAGLDRVLEPDTMAYIEEQATRLEAGGAAATLARRVASFRSLASACEIVRLAGAMHPVMETGVLYALVGGCFHLEWLRLAASAVVTGDAWEHLARSTVIDDFWTLQSLVTEQALQTDGPNPERLQVWLEGPRAASVESFRRTLSELRAAPAPTLTMLTVVARRLGRLVQRAR